MAARRRVTTSAFRQRRYRRPPRWPALRCCGACTGYVDLLDMDGAGPATPVVRLFSPAYLQLAASALGRHDTFEGRSLSGELQPASASARAVIAR